MSQDPHHGHFSGIPLVHFKHVHQPSPISPPQKAAPTCVPEMSASSEWKRLFSNNSSNRHIHPQTLKLLRIKPQKLTFKSYKRFSFRHYSTARPQLQSYLLSHWRRKSGGGEVAITEETIKWNVHSSCLQCVTEDTQENLSTSANCPVRLLILQNRDSRLTEHTAVFHLGQ